MPNIYTKEELQALDLKNMPKHVAIIMDGNRRWARQKGLSSIEGHFKGAENFIQIIKAAEELGIEVVSAFAFSTENWQRDQEEIHELMALLETFLISQREFLQEKGISLKLIGNLSLLPESVQKAYLDTHAATKQGKKMTLMVGLNYGARDEILRAVNRFLKEKPSEPISEKILSSYLDTAPFRDPDLVVRTGKEIRLSNFLLWQSSYSEFVFVDLFWPDFTQKNFLESLLEYQKRIRRMGG